MSEASPEFDPATAVAVGRIIAPHGIRGEVKVEPLTDFPERFRRGARLWLKGEPHRIEGSRNVGRLVYLKLSGVPDRTVADSLREQTLAVPRPRRIEDEDTYYQHDIVGLRVEDESGAVLGQVESIFETGANDVYVIRGERGELLLPAIEDVVKEVDVAGGRLIVALIPGLEFTKAADAAARPPRRPAPRKPKSPPAAPPGV